MYFDKSTMSYTMEIENDEGEEIMIVIPAKFEVCYYCGGKGSHVHPDVDSNGISSGEFYDDPDFEEDYFGGVYDVTCIECKGDRVFPVVDRNACSEEILRIVDSWNESERMHWAEVAAERKMGC